LRRDSENNLIFQEDDVAAPFQKRYQIFRIGKKLPDFSEDIIFTISCQAFFTDKKN
jgi:hypothetical protein